MSKSSVLAIAVAFIVLGLLDLVMPQGVSGVNSIIAGVAALVVGWLSMGKAK